MNPFAPLPKEVDPIAQRFTRLAIPILGVAMYFLFGWGLLAAILRFKPGSDEAFLPTLIGLAAIEAMFSYLRVHTLESGERALFRIAEWITLLVVIKVFLVLQRGGSDVTSLLRSWQDNFLNSFLDWPFVGHVALVAAVWASATYLMAQLDQLHQREQDASWEDAGKLSNSLKQIRQHILGLWAGMLVLLLGLTSISTASLQIPDLLSMDRVADSPVWLPMLFAILLLIQFSLTQFVLLRARWHIDRATVTRAVSRNWLAYGMIFLTVIGLLAALLPTNYTISFFDLVRGLGEVIAKIAGFIFAILLAPFILLSRLFPHSETTVPSEAAAPQATLSPTPIVSAPAWPGWDIFRVGLFWIVFFAVIGFAIYQMVASNSAFLPWIASLPFVRWFSAWFKGLKEWLGKSAEVVREQVKRLQLPARLPAIARPTFRRGPALPVTPRERVMRLYRDLLQQTRRHGMGRKDHQTPYQYELLLGGQLPGVKDDINQATAGFVEARYSLHPLDQANADQVDGEIKRVLAALESRDQSQGS